MTEFCPPVLQRLIAALAMIGLIAGCAGNFGVRDESQVRALVERFVDSVNRADSEAFVGFFTDDATAFFPTNAARNSGLTEIRQAIKPAFAQGPRNPAVHANDLSVAVSDDLAVASFDAGSGALHARRTLVMRRFNGEWKIIHLHASNVAESQ